MTERQESRGAGPDRSPRPISPRQTERDLLNADLLARYVQETGRFPVLRSDRGKFLRNARDRYAEDRLAPEVIARLDAIPGDWLNGYRLRESIYETTAEAAAFRAEHGRLPIPGKDPGGIRISRLRTRSRRGELPAAAEDHLDATLGKDWRWSSHDERARKWEELFSRAVSDYARTGRRPTADRSDIGRWIEKQRSLARQGRLRADRIARLDEHLPGWDGRRIARGAGRSSRGGKGA